MKRLLLLLCGWLMTGATVWAYEEIQVTDGGTVTGKVGITAGKPIPKGFNLVTFPDPVYCGSGGERRSQECRRLVGRCDYRQTI